MDTEALAGAVIKRIFVELEASARHVHVTREQAMQLFGHSLTPKRPLSQPGQYLAQERLTVIGPKGQLEHVAVLGPERSQAQVEISLTDGRTLGINPPIRASGNVKNSPGITLEGPCGAITVPEGVIAAQRHIHMTPAAAATMGVKDKQTVQLQTFTQRPVIFSNVLVRVSDQFSTFAHLDFDEANACGFQPGDLGRILP